MQLVEQRAAVVIMARRPGSGNAKTRLGARLDERERATLYEAFLIDKLAQIASIAGAHLLVAVAPPDPPSSIAPWLPDGATAIAQRGDDLGARLAAVAGDAFALGAKIVLLVDSDTPTLPPAYIDEAIRALESGAVDVVFGPAWDGGYYLVGMRALVPELFRGVTWSTPSVFAESLAIADRAQQRVHILPSWYDVDTVSDLDQLTRDLAQRSPYAPGYPKETARLLGAQVDAAREVPRDEHWRTRSLRRVYANRWADVTERVVTLNSGHVTLYGVVRTSACVGVLPFVADDAIALVRQFRYVARQFTWEMPTGAVQPGESVEDAARRELREEAALDAISLDRLASYDTSKSIVEETAHLFRARVRETSQAAGDPTEEFERRTFSIAEAQEMAHRGEIRDGMTLFALSLVATSTPSR